MENYNRTYRLLAWCSMLSGVAYYFTVLFLGEVPKDEGDGLQHFAIAQESWNQPILFLEHWGKPFFTLFSSGFAQFGFEGYVSFNILVFLLSCLVGFKLLEQYNTPKIICFLFPWILITIPDYSNSIIGGMTEPFFGLILLCLFLLAVREKWILFAVMASFTPFARSEGMFVVIASIPYLLLFRKWKSIPLLGIGFLMYGIAGWLLLDQPLWYFENNPYSPISVYGSGPWNTYILSCFDHLGLIAIGLSPFAIFGLFIWKSKGKRADIIHVLFFGAIYLGIILIHSYLWAKGLRGALGLSRLAILGLLPFLILEAIALGFVLRELHKMIHAFVLLLIAGIIVKEIRELELPTKENPYQHLLKETSAYLHRHENEVGKIYYFHPLVAYYLGFNTKHLGGKYEQRYIKLKQDVLNTFKPGDLIVRDSKFGAVEQGLLLRELEKYYWIVPVKHFFNSDFYREINGESKSVIIYEVMDKRTFNRSEWEKTIVKPSTGKSFRPNETFTLEYVNIDTSFILPTLYGQRQELLASVQLEKNDKEPVYLIFDSKSGYYLSIPITTETHQVSLAFVTGNIKGMLFIHNPSKKPFKLSFEPKNWKQTIDSGILPIK